MFITKVIFGHFMEKEKKYTTSIDHRQCRGDCRFRKISIIFSIRRYGVRKVSRENVNMKLHRQREYPKNKEISRPPPPAVAYVLPHGWIIHEMLPFLTSFAVVRKKYVSTKEWWPPARYIDSYVQASWNMHEKQTDASANLTPLILYVVRFSARALT